MNRYYPEPETLTDRQLKVELDARFATVSNGMTGEYRIGRTFLANLTVRLVRVAREIERRKVAAGEREATERILDEFRADVQNEYHTERVLRCIVWILVDEIKKGADPMWSDGYVVARTRRLVIAARELEMRRTLEQQNLDEIEAAKVERDGARLQYLSDCALSVEAIALRFSIAAGTTDPKNLVVRLVRVSREIARRGPLPALTPAEIRFRELDAQKAYRVPWMSVV